MTMQGAVGLADDRGGTRALVEQRHLADHVAGSEGGDLDGRCVALSRRRATTTKASRPIWPWSMTMVPAVIVISSVALATFVELLVGACAEECDAPKALEVLFLARHVPRPYAQCRSKFDKNRCVGHWTSWPPSGGMLFRRPDCRT